MPQTILRVAIALVAFGAGVTASTFYNAVFGPSSTVSRYSYIRTEPARRHGCSKSWRSMSELPPPPPAPLVVPEVHVVPDVPPPPPTFKKRVTIKLPDGTVQVVESTAETVERKR